MCIVYVFELIYNKMYIAASNNNYYKNKIENGRNKTRKDLVHVFSTILICSLVYKILVSLQKIVNENGIIWMSVYT